MIYSDLKEILVAHGYEISELYAYTYGCGVLESIDWIHKDTGKWLLVCVQPTDEYEKELEALPDGTEIEWDDTKLEVTGVALESVFVTESGFMDNSKDGILLKDKNIKERYKLLDAISGDEGMSCYYTHGMEYLETAIFAQTKPFEHEINILKAHMENLERIKTEFWPVLEKYDFFQEYSSLFSITEKGYSKDCSDPTVVFRFKYPGMGGVIAFYTDCLDGRLKLSNLKEFPENFEEWLTKDFMCYCGETCLEYKYLFDPDYIAGTSYTNFWKIAQGLDDYDKGYKSKEWLKKLSFEGLPMKDNQYLKDRYDRVFLDD